MLDSLEVVHLDLNNKNILNDWISLLAKEGLSNLTRDDSKSLDKTLGIYANGELVATVSSEKNIIKYVAIDEASREGGSVFNKLLSSIINDLATRQIFHLFVFTKPSYSQSFQYLGFKELAATEKGCLLETGDQVITDYLADIPKVTGEKVASIVMNANPFTLGHRYLVETAAKENDVVYVFVVSADKSFFTTAERFKLVQDNTADLSNVIVCEASDYQVSPVTFPTYFLQEEDDQVAFQTELDATLFKTWFVPDLAITSRYLGEEPFSPVTNIYNQSLVKVLEPEVEVKVIPRTTAGRTEAISASEVRRLLKEEDWSILKELVPQGTYDFLITNQEKLKNRLKM